MELFEAKVEEAKIYRVCTPNDEVRETLDEMDFTEHGGIMAMYHERYADADKIMQEYEGLEGNFKHPETAKKIYELANEIQDGTICFYEA